MRHENSPHQWFENWLFTRNIRQLTRSSLSYLYLLNLNSFYKFKRLTFFWIFRTYYSTGCFTFPWINLSTKTSFHEKNKICPTLMDFKSSAVRRSQSKQKDSRAFHSPRQHPTFWKNEWKVAWLCFWNIPLKPFSSTTCTFYCYLWIGK